MRLSRFERRWAGEVARAFVEPGVLGGAVDDVDAGAAVALDCELAPWIAAAPVRLAIWLVWFWPLPRRGRTFGRLTNDAREQLLDGLLHARSATVRMMVSYLKLICVSVVLGDRRALAALGAYGSRA